MISIHVINDIGIEDAGDVAEVESKLSNFTIDLTNEIEINMTNCIIDYPAMAILLDYFFEHVCKSEGTRKITLLLSYHLPEQLLMNWILLGSKFFKLERDRELNISDLRSKILPILLDKEIQFVIKYGTDSKNTLNYGKAN